MLFIFNFLFSPLPTPALICILTFGAAIFLWLINRPHPVLPLVDLNKQSVGLEGGARRGPCQDNDLIRYYFSDAKTMYEVFQRGIAVSDNGPCLGYRKPNQPYRWLSYKQVSDRAEYLGSCLLHKGYKPSQEHFVGIFAQNRPEWVISEFACYTYSMVAVPLYDTLGEDAIIYIVNKADITTVICDTPQKALVLIGNVEKGLTPGLKLIILMDPFEDDLKKRGEKCGVEILSLFDAEAVVYSCGARVGFFQGDIRLLPDDMKTLKPTVFPAVPRLLNRVYDKVQNEAKTPLKKFLLNLAVASKFSEVKKGIIRRNSFWDKLIFGKIQESLGGKVRLMVTGAAPISSPVLTFLRAAMGCPGTAGSCFILSHVGVPIACNHVKLEDVADMNYFAVNNEGQICIKGTNVFKGYLKDPEKTEEALDKDGWLHTGDIGRWLPNGTLKVIDRKKNIFKLAQGEYIAPEKIEDIYIRSSLVKRIYLHPEPFSIENGLLTPTMKAKRGELAKYFRTQINSLYEKIQE
ncbi:hypothetical protein J1605_022058 [Eschrichtius robustus]|uniref:long-chain-fatty-acid--CoA ligase n=1 Tax=Eschrichtius robustus TaxID=9764 RepID=A0AB34HET4_ESCRO|nr:hypothetical protein J1605_022058 [Eschrichtius robustus]